MSDTLDLARMTPTADVAYLDPGEIRGDGGTQMRAAFDISTIEEYTAVMLQHDGWGPFPPITVYYDGSNYWLADGFHRLAALRRSLETDPPIEDRRAPARIIPGTRRDAILHAVAANANHGLRRTSADKRRSVQTLLRDGEWQQWSDAEIARRCAVDAKTVATVRKSLESTLEIPESPVRKTTAGREVNTAKIGAVRPQRPPMPVTPGRVVYVEPPPKPDAPQPRYETAHTPDDVWAAGYWIVLQSAGWMWTHEITGCGMEHGAPFPTKDEAIADARRIIAGRARMTPPVDARIAQAQALRNLIAHTRGEINAHYGDLCGTYTDTLAFDRGCDTMIERLDSLVKILSKTGSDGTVGETGHAS